jgi:hypothetical protein
VPPTGSLLSPASPADVVAEPFPHLVRASALPSAHYRLLADEFPSLAVVAEHAPALGSNQAVRLSAVQALGRPDLSASWRRFFELHTSGEYWDDIVRVFRDALRTALPGLETRIGRPFERWRVARRGDDVDADARLDCQFVMNTPVTTRGSVKTPHVDRHDKIFSALLYMRPPDDPTAGGDLDLYRWRRAPRFLKHRVLPSDVEHVRTIPYAPNIFVAFVNSPGSVHGVSPRDVTDIPRRYVNFIVEVPVRAFEPVQAGPWHRWRHGRRDDD